jgi:hypothetical protein
MPGLVSAYKLDLLQLLLPDKSFLNNHLMDTKLPNEFKHEHCSPLFLCHSLHDPIHDQFVIYENAVLGSDYGLN